MGLQDSQSADEIECSSDEDDMSPGFAGTAATSMSARGARQRTTLVMRLSQPLLNLLFGLLVCRPHNAKQSTYRLLIQDSARASTDGSQRQQTLTAFMKPVDPGR